MRLLFAFGLSLFLMTSCGEDNTATIETVSIEGDWVLSRALRNNMETAMLDGLVFTFQPDGTLETNLMENESPGTYEWSEDKIVTEGVKLPLTYTIRELTDSTLNIRSTYQSYQFDFEMVRGKAQENF